MDTYLQHLKLLREKMNDHEDKVAWLSAERSEQDSYVQHLRKDVESVRADINKTKEEVEAISKETSETSNLIISRQKELEVFDANSSTLSHALEVLDDDISQRSSRLLESKSNYAKLEADARLQLDIYQAHYKSLQGETKELDVNVAQAAEDDPGVEEKADDGPIADDVAMAEGGDDGVEPEVRLRQLQEEAHRAEEDLKRTDANNLQLEAGFEALEESLSGLKEEKLAEEEFIHTLRNRLELLKDYSQEVVCGSCKHVYVIECEGAKFVARSL